MIYEDEESIYFVVYPTAIGGFMCTIAMPVAIALWAIASLILAYQTFRWMDDVRDGINALRDKIAPLGGKRAAPGEEWKEQYKDKSGGGEDDAASEGKAEGVEI